MKIKIDKKDATADKDHTFLTRKTLNIRKTTMLI